MGTLAACAAYAGLLAAAWLFAGWAGRTCDRWTARRELVREAEASEAAAIARAKATYSVGNGGGI